MNRKLIAVLFLLCLASVYALEGYGAVNVLDFKDDVIAIGTDKEDWQPAIQKAVAKAYATTRTLYFPAGTYNIQKALDFGREPTQMYISGLTVNGDGRFTSIIKQNNPKENCINWTGKTYKGSIQGGTINGMCILGGDIALNMKWHNTFTLTHCYAGNARIGIYAEGWSNRYIDFIIRHCSEKGFVGCAHFNDCTLRDGYLSRCGIGICFDGGARGVRVSGIGIEQTVKCAMYIRLSLAIAISECYFEGNAMAPVKGWQENCSIWLDYGNNGISVNGCIFRGTAKNCGHIAIGSGENIAIQDNVDQIHLWGTDALIMLAHSSHPRFDTGIKDLKVENNNFCYGGRAAQPGPIDYRYFEREAGLFDKAVQNGAVLEGGKDFLRTMTQAIQKDKTDAVDYE